LPAVIGFLNEQSQFVRGDGSRVIFDEQIQFLSADPPDSQYHGRKPEQPEAVKTTGLSALFGGFYRIGARLNRAVLLEALAPLQRAQRIFGFEAFPLSAPAR